MFISFFPQGDEFYQQKFSPVWKNMWFIKELSKTILSHIYSGNLLRPDHVIHWGNIALGTLTYTEISHCLICDNAFGSRFP